MSYLLSMWRSYPGPAQGANSTPSDEEPIFEDYAEESGERLLRKKTLGAEKKQEVQLLFSEGVKGNFVDGGWDQRRYDFRVFNSSFVEKNVYSGSKIEPSHKRRYLDLAIGNVAVSFKLAYENEDLALQEAKKALSEKERSLQQYCDGIELEEFVKLEKVEDLDNKIEFANRKIEEFKARSAILKHPLPVLPNHVVNSFSTESFFDVLRKEVSDLHKSASEYVADVISGKRFGDYRGWLRQGIDFADENCPFCLRPFDESSPVEYYKLYFTREYDELVGAINRLPDLIEKSFGEHVLEKVESQFSKFNDSIRGWLEHVEVGEVSVDLSRVASHLENIRKCLNHLIKEKGEQPLSPIVDEGRELFVLKNVQELNDYLWGMVEECKAEVEKINDFKSELSDQDFQVLKGMHKSLSRSKARFSSDVERLIQVRNELIDKKKEHERKRKAAREDLDEEMRRVLNLYQGSINSFLRSTGASFSLEIDHDYRGGSGPRADYNIVLNGHSLNASGGYPNFSSALSEGDRRTLAFAFFVASLEQDRDIGNKIVVVDDPVCSLDFHRRKKTVEYLKHVAERASQCIILSHDALFLKKIKDSLSPVGVSVGKVAGVKGGGSVVTGFDLDAFCESDYIKAYRSVVDYVEGNDADFDKVKREVRIMVEGYLKSRFPNEFAGGVTLGAMITSIQQSSDGQPLSHVKHLVSSLRSLNDYFKEYHHVDPLIGDVSNHEELRGYAYHALQLIYTDNPKK